ncbi:MAG: L-threonylcarbamoyladenylate synthase [Pelagibacteraceae bacterium]
MKNIYSNIFKVNNSIMARAIKYLKKNQAIGVPTETVYGIAGNAYSNSSIQKIYNLKNRPKINPLIVHFYNFKHIQNDVEIDKRFLKLYKKFCPGPITFVLKKKLNSKISKLATANLSTVAIRFPKHRIIRQILKKLKFPLAIPSGNKSQSVSPVTASDVAEEFKHKLKFIIDGGRSNIGIESTVVDLTGKIKILRPGLISREQINGVLKINMSNFKNPRVIKSPGSLKKHYSPGIPMVLNKKRKGEKHAFIIFGKKYKNNKNVFNLSKNANLKEAAKNLYRILRKIKKLKYKKIYVVKIKNKGVGMAINDRLKHAANK